MSDGTAQVFEAPGQPLALRTFPLPNLRAGEALVRVDLCTLCGSDLHTYLGKRTTPCPTILGHEILGRIQSLAGDIADTTGEALREGDRVVWSLAVSCHSCFYCEAGLPQKCESLVKFGHEPITEKHVFHGGLASHCHLPAGAAIFRVPDGLSDALAAPATCATATAVASLDGVPRLDGSTVLIFGAGMLGLTASALARTRGTKRVLLCDKLPERLARAADFGADPIQVDDDPRKVQGSLYDATDGRGADILIEMSGSADCVETGVDLVRTGGQLVLVGSVFPSRPVLVWPEQVVRRHLTVRGVHNYAPHHLRAALAFLSEQANNYPFDELVEETFPLERAEEAFTFARVHRPYRVGVRP